jgi:hypothetical protein
MIGVPLTEEARDKALRFVERVLMMLRRERIALKKTIGSRSG